MVLSKQIYLVIQELQNLKEKVIHLENEVKELKKA
jgi:hypothetical protein